MRVVDASRFEYKSSGNRMHRLFDVQRYKRWIVGYTDGVRVTGREGHDINVLRSKQRLL